MPEIVTSDPKNCSQIPSMIHFGSPANEPQIAYTTLYVLPFYLSALTRPSPDLPRDSPTVIRARVRSVTLSCALCSVITICILSFYAHVPRLQILKLLGWYPIDIAGTAKPLLLTALLFAGPLFEKGVVDGKWKEWIRGRKLYECLDSWIGWRNYVAVRTTPLHTNPLTTLPLTQS